MTAASETPRYTDFPFPDERYLPGTGMLHPRKKLTASHIPQIPPAALAFDAKTWRFSQRYLYAVDLFNYQYWWEAHEVLEDVWMAAGKRTPVGKFVQGLIQIAASLLKDSQSVHQGAQRLAQNGLSKIRSQTGVFLGVDIDEFGRQVEACIFGGASAPPKIGLTLNDDLRNGRGFRNK